MTCLRCSRPGPLLFGYCAACRTPSGTADDRELVAKARRRKTDANRRARARKAESIASPIVVVGAVAAVPVGHEQRLVVDWATGRVAGAIVYHRTESATAVEDAHREACRAAGVWTPAIARST